MSPRSAALWQAPLPADFLQETAAILEQVQPRVFFRADDLHRADAPTLALLELFQKHRVPLAPALVPAWLSPMSWRAFPPRLRQDPLFAWHQHGWSHVNHEVQGKKQEFGDSRGASRLIRDLDRGQARLARILGRAPAPIFTPPWNRCGRICLDLLLDRGLILSRDSGARPPAPPGLRECPVNLDLHTRGEPDPAAGRAALLASLRRAAATGIVGVMLHHHLMNQTAWDFLAFFLRRSRALAVALEDLA